MKLNINKDAHKALGLKVPYKSNNYFETHEVSEKQIKSLGNYDIRKEGEKKRMFRYKHTPNDIGCTTNVSVIMTVSSNSGLITFDKEL